MSGNKTDKNPSAYRFADFTLDLERGSLHKADHEVKLRPKVFDALRFLVDPEMQAAQVVTTTLEAVAV